MHDKKNITIVLLCVSAALLLTVLLVVHGTRQASATMSESRGGDYIWASGRIGPGFDWEVVYVIDTASQRMLGYQVPRNSNSIELVPGAIVDLRAAFSAGAAPAPPGGGRR
jgi:hypothetical protein